MIAFAEMIVVDIVVVGSLAPGAVRTVRRAMSESGFLVVVAEHGFEGCTAVVVAVVAIVAVACCSAASVSRKVYCKAACVVVTGGRKAVSDRDLVMVVVPQTPGIQKQAS